MSGRPIAGEFKYTHRAGTAAQWADPQDGPLLRAEIGVLLDDDGTPLDAKVGDGETAFADLPSLGGNGTSDPLGFGVPSTFLTPSAESQTAVASDVNYLANVGAALSISKVGLHVGVSAGNIAVAVYDNDGTGGAPGTRLASSGSVACPTAGYAEVALGSTLTIERGQYLALWTSSATAAFLVQLSAGAVTSDLFAKRCYYESAVGGPPATATPIAAMRRPWLLVGVA